MLYFKEENFIRKKLNYCFELKETASYIEVSIIQSEFSQEVLRELRAINKQFSEMIKKLTGYEEPGITFYSLGEGPFNEPVGSTKIKISAK